MYYIYYLPVFLVLEVVLLNFGGKPLKLERFPVSSSDKSFWVCLLATGEFSTLNRSKSSKFSTGEDDPNKNKQNNVKIAFLDFSLLMERGNQSNLHMRNLRILSMIRIHQMLTHLTSTLKLMIHQRRSVGIIF